MKNNKGQFVKGHIPASFTDLTGKKFNRWFVIKRAETPLKGVYWLCRCECGKEKIVVAATLKSGVSKSCGCYLRDFIIATKTTHGLTYSREYEAWCAMKERCYTPSVSSYPNYGGKGITVCDRWVNDFAAFYKDMGKKPTPKHSLDRFPNVNGNYEPSNCRWATMKQQQGNRTNNKWIEYKGEKMILADFARLVKCSPAALNNYKRRNGLDKAIKHFGE
jgi:hypothetical protein